MTSSAKPKKKSSLKDLLQLPLILVLSIAAIGIIVPEAIAYMYDVKAKQWPVVNAQITKFDAPITVTLKDPYFDCQVEYKYTVDGKEYSSARLSYAKRPPLLGYDMGRFEENHKPGVDVPVHVEPGNPQNAVMDPVDSPVAVISYFIALVVVYSSVYFALYPVVDVVNSKSDDESSVGTVSGGNDEATIGAGVALDGP